MARKNKPGYIIYEDFNPRIKHLRKENRYSKAYVAKCIGINHLTYTRYELNINEMPADILIRFCKFYNVSADYFLRISDVRKPFKCKHEIKLK